jgi:hypothetical protein
MQLLSNKAAQKLILALLDAGHDGVLADCQDGGENVDIIFSRRKGHESEVMGLAESEQRMDAAIRFAWKTLTGKTIAGDPVEFINRKGTD